jgi:hypothetical protein
MKIPVIRIAVAACIFVAFSGTIREAAPHVEFLSPNPHVNRPADCLLAYRFDLPCIPFDTLHQWIEKGIPQQQYAPNPYRVKRVHIPTAEEKI